ncbi:MAG: S46 family peptidase [Thermoanaerobaculales bacterium]
MRRTLLTVIIAMTGIATGAGLRADEGMWLLDQIPQLAGTMKAMGLQLSPKQIWDPETNTGLASATPWLGGCSSSFVSPDGLIITNHHCAFGALQINSTPEHDYITNGFLAATRSQELEAKGTRVTVFKGYQEVTAKVLAALSPEMTPDARTKAIERTEKALVAECEKSGLRCRVAAMFGGGKYYLFRQLELRDIRLVYAPPNATGDFGGEVDNWMWPRHAGDYSFLRAYVGPDGSPADYSPANVPYRPDRFLKIASDPLKEGDFTMVLGYPGRTFRYRISRAIADDVEFNYPQRIKILKDLIDIYEAQGKRSKDVEIKLASQLKGFYNTYKNNQGMLEGLRRSALADRKRAEEDKLSAWINGDAARRTSYGDVLPQMEKAQLARQTKRERDALLFWLPPGRSSSLLAAATLIERWSSEKAKPDLERELGFQARDERTLRQRLANMQKNMDVETERAVLTYLFGRAIELPAGQRIEALAATGKTGDAASSALLDKLLGGTALGDSKTRLAFFDLDHTALLAKADPMIAFAATLRRDTKAQEDATKAFDGEMVTLAPRLIAALAAWKNAPVYPDANSTLRLTYATVQGYAPRDGVYYKPFTTLAGVIEKQTGQAPFASPARLLAAARGRLAGRYLDARLGDVPACFLTSNDITGGNSGSPVMNGKGELVGLAFDGNWESMTADYQFDPELTRTIAVDIRYVLWCMDYVDHAHVLMRELGVEPASK